ncbi:MAG: Trm112 family protein [Acidobacteriaceae bacterium]
MSTGWNHELRALLVCPVCRQALESGSPDGVPSWLLCHGCRRRYPVLDGIPVLIAARAEPMEGPYE